MAIIKSFTDISQSKKLAEILPLESADMWYHGFFTPRMCKIEYNPPAPYHSVTPQWDCPCWSLAALLNVIPKEIFNGEYVINITDGLDNKWIITYDTGNSSSFYGLVSSSDNIIDSCVDIIEKLHKLKML